MLQVLSLGIVFFGFGAPFLIYGTPGLIAGGAAIVIGSVAFWFVEPRTRCPLKPDSVWNIVMKAGGDTQGIFSHDEDKPTQKDSDER